MKKHLATTMGEMPTKKSWLKKVGLAGFLFFLIKGLVWLALAGWVAWKAG